MRVRLPSKLRNPLTLAVAPGFKSVNLKTVGFDSSDCALKNREFAFAAFPSASLNPRKGSLGTSAELENRSAHKSVGSAACEPEAVPSIFAEN